MIRTILLFGVAAGVIVVLPMLYLWTNAPEKPGAASELIGYLVMIVALSLIFVGVKRYRDRVLGGVIGFGPALLAGLGISTVAGIFYVIGWEITLAASHYAFADSYSQAMIAAARAKGASPAELARIGADLARFRAQYANPLYRLPMTFVEIFPVGGVISLITAALLRNRRFLPARPQIGAGAA